MAGVKFDIEANNAQFLAAMEQANKAFEQLKNYAEQSGQSIDSAITNMSDTMRNSGGAVDEMGGKFKNLAANIAGIAGVAWGGMQFLKQMTQVRSEIQNTEASLRVFLGSTKKASSFLNDLQDAAFWNVFEFSELSDAANQMLAFNHSAETVIPNLQRLSEVASGTGKPLGDLVNMYNRVKSLDKMDTRMLDQFKTMGIDVVQTLADIEGVSTSMIDKSSLKFADLQKAIEAETNEGGKYFGMMQSKMDNVSDKVGQLKDNVTSMLNDMGKQTDGILKGGIDVLNHIVENWQKYANVLTVVVGALGIYKTALLVVTAAQKINNAVVQNGSIWKAIMNKATLSIGKSLGLESAKHGLNTIAIQAETKALLAQKAVRMGLIGAVLAGVAALAYALYTLNKDGSSKEEKALAAVDKEFQKVNKSNKEFIDSAREAVNVINSETKSVTELAAAYNTLRKIEAFKGKSNAEIKQMLQENPNIIDEEEEKRSLEDSQKVLEKRKKGAYSVREVMNSPAARSIGLTENDMLTSAKLGELSGSAQKQFDRASAAAEEYANKRIASLNKIADVQSRKDNLNEWIKELQEENKTVKKNSLEYALNVKQIMLFKKERENLEQKEATTYSVESQVQKASEDLKNAEQQIQDILSGAVTVEDPAKEIDNLNKVVSNAQSKLKALTGQDFVLSGKSYDQVNDAISDEEKALAKVQADMKNGITPELLRQQALHQKNLKNLQSEKKIIEENNPTIKYRMDLSLEDITDRNQEIQKRLDEISEELKLHPSIELTNEQAKLQEEQQQLQGAYKARQGTTDAAWNAYKSRKQALMEEQKLLDTQLATERQKIEATKKAALEQLKLDNAEYARNNTGASDPAYAQKKKNILLQAQLDLKELDKQWNDWKVSKEREEFHLRTDIELDIAKNELANAVTEVEKEAAKRRIRIIEDQKTVNANTEAREGELLSKLGGDRDKLAQYQKALKEGGDIASILGIDADTVKQLDDITKHYDTLLELQQQQVQIGRDQEDLSAEISRLQAYYEEAERIEQEYQNKLIEFREKGATNAQYEQARDIRDQRMAQAGAKLGSGDEVALANRFVQFGKNIAGLTFEEIDKQYIAFMATLESDIRTLEGEVNAAKEQAKLDAEALATSEADLAEVNAQLGGENLTEKEKTDLLAQRKQIEENIVAIKKRQEEGSKALAEKEKQLQFLEKGRITAQTQAIDAKDKAETKEQRSNRMNAQSLEELTKQFQAVNDGVNAVADAFGGALSKKGKKALETISDIADFGITAVQSIGSVMSETNMAILSGVGTATTAMQAMEQASVILTIISAAVQVIMKLVQVFSKFTYAAQLQEQIDDYKDKVEDLKNQQERLEKSYQRSVGSEYYKGMAKAAQAYNQVIQENNKAIEKAQELYDLQVAKYREESDKAKEAKEQLDELKDSGEDYADSQKQMYDELAESLLGTNVTSFAEGLADSLVSAWQEGTTDMTEIWDTMLDDMKRDMMKKALSIALTDMFNDTFQKIASLAQNGELNQAEIDAAIAEIDAKSEEAQVIAEQWRQAMSDRGLLDDANPEADKGGFQSMSQDTADELNARFTALQMEGAAVETATNAMRESVTIMQANSDRSLLLMQDIDRFQQLAYEQSQEHISLIRAISETVAKISTDTARLKAIEQNTNELR